MVPQIVRLYNQMPEPKYVVAMGACASGGGPFKEGYNVVSGIDKFLPVDVYIPGCPPTPQALLFGLMKLQEMMDNQSIKTVRWYQKEDLPAIPIPILGPDLLDPRDFPEFKEKLAEQVTRTSRLGQVAKPASNRVSPQKSEISKMRGCPHFSTGVKEGLHQDTRQARCFENKSTSDVKQVERSRDVSLSTKVEAAGNVVD